MTTGDEVVGAHRGGEVIVITALGMPVTVRTPARSIDDLGLVLETAISS